MLAIYDPTSVENNRYGIHIFSEKDLNDAERLVNSTGGDWGYVTFVITELERDHDRWQKVFDEMRRRHLIPIVRLATKAGGEVWEKPKEEEINNWIAFLNSLNWVIENRYVIISNEPNHAGEWGGSVNPQEYASYLREFSQKLKSASPDFFVLPAGLDASAINSQSSMEESAFIRGMIRAVPDVFDNIDGWVSHSYPDSGYFGTATFQWETDYLKKLGVTKDYPIFITETGWSNTKFGEDQIAINLQNSLQNSWNSPNIVAITPFILSYPQAPFAQFSWQKSDGTYYKFFQTVQGIKKVKGEPRQIVSGQILGAIPQPLLFTGSDFVGVILARNTGQSIWAPDAVSVKSDSGVTNLTNYPFNEIEPMRLGLIIFKATAPSNIGIYSKNLYLAGPKGRRITNSFGIEGLVIRLDKMQIQGFFDKLLSFIKLRSSI